MKCIDMKHKLRELLTACIALAALGLTGLLILGFVIEASGLIAPFAFYLIVACAGGMCK